MNFQQHARSLINWLFSLMGTIGVLVSFLIDDRYSTMRGLMLNLGSTLIATSLLAFLYQHFGERSLAEHLRDLRDSFEIVRRSLEAGIEEFWPQRRDIPNSMWNQFTEKASNEVSLLGVAEYGFAADEGFRTIVKKGVKRGCKFQFLLLDPACDFASHWDDRDKTGLVPSKIRSAIQRFEKIVNENITGPGSVELRVYSEPPCMSIVKSDHQMIVSLYMPSFQGDDCFTMRLKDIPNGLYPKFQVQFNELWGPARILVATQSKPREEEAP